MHHFLAVVKMDPRCSIWLAEEIDSDANACASSYASFSSFRSCCYRRRIVVGAPFRPMVVVGSVIFQVWVESGSLSLETVARLECCWPAVNDRARRARALFDVCLPAAPAKLNEE